MALRAAVVALLAAACIGLAAYFAYFRGYQSAPMEGKISSVTFDAATVSVEVADTEAAREQGLSDRVGLAPNSGMLFVFDSPSLPGFWMKDMQFNLDMIFIDASGKVVTVDQNLSPQTYKASPPEVFYPASPVVYVLEVPAGYAAAHGVAVGSQAEFK